MTPLPERRRICNAANLLTLSRLAMGPVLAWLILSSPARHEILPGAQLPRTPLLNEHSPSNGIVADAEAPPGITPPGIARDSQGDPAPQPCLFLVLFVLLGLTLLTDLLDGWLARRLRVVTDFGKIMDPVADSALCMTILFALSASPRFRDHFPIWFPLIVLYREVGMQVLRRYGALSGRVLAARWSGKAKMFVQSLALLGFFALVAISDWAGGTPFSPSDAAGARPWLMPESALGLAAFWVGVAIAAVNALSLIEYMRDIPALIRERQA